VWQVKLGRYCEEGQGVPRDSEVAVRLYRTAAERCKNVDAMMQLARCFVDGVGVQPSAAMAAWWHQQAASAVRLPPTPAHAHAERRRELSICLLRGAARKRKTMCVEQRHFGVTHLYGMGMCAGERGGGDAVGRQSRARYRGGA